MMAAHFPWLTLLIAWPLLGALVTSCCRNVHVMRNVAVSVAIIELLAALLVVYKFDVTQGDQFQFIESYAWIPSLNVQFMLGVDGIAILFLPMSALLTLMAILASWHSVQQQAPFYFALLLALQAITIGVFTALDMLLFFTFWELTLPAIFFLLGLWGIGPHRREAAIKYVLFMLFGGAALLIAIIILALYSAPPNPGQGLHLVFNLPQLLANPLPDKWQSIVFVLLLLGFAVKTPLLPFHTWLPTVAMEGPVQLTALLMGLKLGVFGIIRFAMPLAPSAAVEYSWILGVLGAITLIYGAFVASYQSNLRRLLAYSAISHVGLVIIGIAALNKQGIQGALFQLFNFTLVANALMLLAGFIQQRLGSTDTVHLGGLAKVVPRLTFFYFLFALASIGLPGTSGFPAELMLIFSALLAHPSLGLAALAGAVLSAGYVLNFIRISFWGPIRHEGILNMQDLSHRELLVLTVPALLVIFLGFAPGYFLQVNDKVADTWLATILEPPIIKNNEVAGSVNFAK